MITDYIVKVTFIVRCLYFLEPCMSPGVSSLSSYSASPGVQYHAVPNGSNTGFTLYCTPEGYIVPTAAQSQVVYLLNVIILYSYFLISIIHRHTYLTHGHLKRGKAIPRFLACQADLTCCIVYYS